MDDNTDVVEHLPQSYTAIDSTGNTAKGNKNNI